MEDNFVIAKESFNTIFCTHSISNGEWSLIFIKVTHPLPFQMERWDCKFLFSERTFSSVVIVEVFPSVTIRKTTAYTKVVSCCTNTPENEETNKLH